MELIELKKLKWGRLPKDHRRFLYVELNGIELCDHCNKEIVIGIRYKTRTAQGLIEYVYYCEDCFIEKIERESIS